ncbi:MAG TPA: hypothetical protein VGG45_19610 [Terracidiphilus sp.]
MPVSRRKFLGTASLTLLGTTVVPSALAEIGGAQTDDRFSPDHMKALIGATSARFKPLIGDNFTVTAPDGARYSWKLINVTDAESAIEPEEGPASFHPASRPKSVQATSFTLTFRGAGDTLPQETYTLEHESLGTFPLFVVPSGPEETPPRYSATFSLLAPGGNVPTAPIRPGTIGQTFGR